MAKRTSHNFDPLSRTWQVLVFNATDQLIQVHYFSNEPEALRFIDHILSP